MLDFIPMQFVYMLPAFLLVLTIIVFVHEMGHYLVARWNGIAVQTFSIGFGPELSLLFSGSSPRLRERPAVLRS